MSSLPHTAKAELEEVLQNSAHGSLEEAVARHLLDCVSRFGEEGLRKATSYADCILEHFSRTRDIARLNDALRRDLDPAANGTVLITAGVKGLGEEVINAAMTALREFDDFTENNDPHHEHDFGSFTASGHKFFWKIDYYDLQMERLSPDPSDPTVTRRVLTLLLPEEY